MKNQNEMTNADIYKTPDERGGAYLSWCGKHCGKGREICEQCPLSGCDAGRKPFMWLAMKVADTLPCPFCGGKVNTDRMGRRFVAACLHCTYQSPQFTTIDEAISSHNRVAKAVISAKNGGCK